MEENDLEEETIIKIIREKLKSGSDLNAIKREISRKLKCELNSYDESFITNECITISLHEFNRECKEILDKISNSNDKKKVRRILDSFGNLKTLLDVSFGDSSNHLRFLINNRNFIGTILEKKHLRDLNSYAWRLVSQLNTSTKLELEFLNLLLQFFRDSYEKVLEFPPEILKQTLTFKTVLLAVTNLKSDESDLKTIALRLLSANEYVLADDIVEAFRQCIRAPRTSKVQTDGRLVIEVNGKYILLSRINGEIERLLSDDVKIEEVRFVGIDVFFIDKDLEAKFWHGKNVVVYANQIRVRTSVVWDISGKDNDHKYAEAASTLSSGEGKDGEDGFAGESGGNCLIIAGKIDDSEKWTIKTKGGKGSNGENGGNGKDGEDGEGMSIDVFNLLRHQNPLNRASQSVQGRSIKYVQDGSSEWYELFETKTGQLVHEVKDSGYYVFYMYKHKLVLAEGTKGSGGGTGGVAGFGGNGGFAGEVKIYCVGTKCKMLNIDGQEGKTGSPGKDGLKGSDGYDLGSYATVTEGLTLYGSNKDSKFKLEQFSDRNGKRVHDARYKGWTYCYSGIVPNGKVTVKKVNDKVDSTKKVTRSKNSHAKAARSKTTTSNQITQAYSELFWEFSKLNDTVTSIASNHNEMGRLAELQKSDAKEETSFCAKNRLNRSVLFDKTSFSNRFIRREEPKVVNNLVSNLIIKSVPRLVMKMFEPLLKSYIKEEDKLLSSPVNSELSSKFLEEFLKVFINHTTIKSQRLTTFVDNHAEFLKMNRIFIETFERELVHHVPELLPLWIKSLEKPWMVQEFEEKITSKSLLNAFYKRMKRYRQTEEKIISILSDNEVVEGLRSFALCYFPSYAFKLFNNFTIGNFNKRVLIEKKKSALLKQIDIELEPKLESLIEKSHTKDQHQFHQVSLANDKFSHDHDSLGRINNYFLTNSAANREKIVCHLKDYFKSYDKNLKALKAMKKYKSFVKINKEKSDHSKSFLKDQISSTKRWWNITSTKTTSTNKMDYRKTTSTLIKLKTELEETEEFGEVYYVTKLLLNPLLTFLSEANDADKDLIFFKKELLKLENHEMSLEAFAPDFVRETALSDIAELSKRKMISRLSRSIFKQAMGVKRVRELFLSDISVNGVKSKNCRNLLASFYELNIQVYLSIDDDSGYHLNENYNCDADKTLRLLKHENGEFCKLQSDEAHQNLLDFRSTISVIYKDILADFDKQTTIINNPTKYVCTYLKSFEATTFKQENKSPIEHPREEQGTEKKSPFLFEEVIKEYLPNKKKVEENIKEFLGKTKKPPKLNKELQSDVKQVSDGELNVELISSHFKAHKEVAYLQDRLKLISFEDGGSEILRAISLSLQNDGVHISLDELTVVLDVILTSCFADYNLDSNIVIWTLRSQSQIDWSIRFVVFQIENLLKAKENAIEHTNGLQKVKLKEVLVLFAQKLFIREEKLTKPQMKEIIESLELMSLNSIHQLSSLKLSSWKYVATEDFFRNKLSQLKLGFDTQEKLKFYVMQMQNVLGSKPVGSLIDLLLEKKSPLKDEDLIVFFQNFYSNEWNLSEETIQTLKSQPAEKWTEILNEMFSCAADDRTVSDLIKIIRNNPNVSNTLKDDLYAVKASIEKVYRHKYLRYTEKEIKEWSENSKQRASFEEKLAVIVRAISIVTKFEVKLRPTQLLTVIYLLRYDRNILAQVSTGEGKSWIGVAIGIFNGLGRRNVDIVTSSKTLAERDANKPEHKRVFELFGIAVGHNCSENDSTRRNVYSSCSVIYGDLGSFQRDYLFENFYNKNIYGGRALHYVLIDEVDSMLLDKGTNILYLSHEIPNMDELKSICIFICEFINQKVESEEQLKVTLNKKVIKYAVYSDMFGSFTMSHLDLFFADRTQNERNEIWHKLIQLQIIDDEGYFVNQEYQETTRKQIKKTFGRNFERINFVIEENCSRNRRIYVPQHLIPFIRLHLDQWIENALRSLTMENEKEYIVDVDRSGVSFDRNPVVIIQDLDTGTDQYNSEWDDALHQFLQLKNGCKLTEQKPKAVFISNVTYFKQYEKVSGMSGTLGSANERDKLNEIHSTDFLVVPTFKPRKFEEIESVLCSNTEEWTKTIISVSTEKALTRSVLVIFETVYEIKQIIKKLELDRRNLIIYDRSFIEPNIFDVPPGKIILATNIAGRGTDITLSNGLEKAGGLHVILSYLPSNVRIEQQGFGRAARCGAKGTGQLIINCSNYGNTKQILELKQRRDELELERIENICDYYNKTIILEESLFKSFQEAFKAKTSQRTDEKLKKVREIEQKNFLDCWTFWLDKNKTTICNSKSNSNAESELKSAWSEVVNQHAKLTHSELSEWENGSMISPLALVNFSKYLETEKRYNDQENIINKACQKDEKNLAANYYKCFAKSRNINNTTDFNRHSSVLQALILFEDRKDLENCDAATLEMIHNKGPQRVGQLKAFKEQIDINHKVIDIFIDSLNNIRGHNVYPESFKDIFDGNSILSETVYNELIKKQLLTKPHIYYRHFMLPVCQKIAYEYGVSCNELKLFLEENQHRDFDDLDDIVKLLKSKIPLPSSEDFWDILIRQGKLEHEVVVVTIDKEKLRHLDPSLLTKLEDVHKSVSGENKGSLSETYKKLQKPSEKNDVEEPIILLYPIKEDDRKENDLEFEEKQLKRLIPKQLDYDNLQKRQVISFNRIARITSNEVHFPSFATMTRRDLLLSKIPENDIDAIIEILVSDKIISERGGLYDLNIESFNGEIDLKHLKMFEPKVLMLFNRFFIYPKALEKLEREAKTNPAYCVISLQSQSHMKLMSDLIASHFIEPSKVKEADKESIDQTIEALYGQVSFALEAFESYLKNSSSIVSNDYSSIIDFVKRSGFLNFVTGSSYLPEHFLRANPTYSGCKDVKASVNVALKNRLFLFEKRKEISDFLVSMISDIKTKESPVLNLKPLEYFTKEFENATEIDVFIKKGLDLVMTVEEERWTWKVIFRFSVVVIVGILQIFIGTLITLVSTGFMYHVGSGVVSEGLGDLIFALSVIKTGHFTWKDYLNHKSASIKTTILTSGLCAFLAKGKVFSELGYKIAGPTIAEGGVSIAKMTGWQVIKQVGVKTTLIETFKNTCISLSKQALISTASYSVDFIMESKINNVINEVNRELNSRTQSKIEHSSLSGNYKKLFEIHGEKEGLKKIKKSLEKSISNEEFDQFSRMLDQTINLADSIKPYLKQSGMKSVSYISDILKIVRVSSIIYELYSLVDRMLDQTNNNLQKYVSENENKKSSHSSQDSKKLKEFEYNANQMVNEKVNQKTSFIAREKILRPLLLLLANHVARHVQKKVSRCTQKLWKNYAEEKIRKKATKSIVRLQELSKSENLSHEEQLDKKVHEEILCKLVINTRSSKTMSWLMRQDIPMNMVAVEASHKVIQDVMRQNGLQEKLKITVKVGDTTCTFGDEGGKEMTVNISEKHFGEGFGNLDHNCYFDAVSDELKAKYPNMSFDLDRDEFRSRICDVIEVDSGIEHAVNEGWHKFSMTKGFYGGQRQTNQNCKKKSNSGTPSIFNQSNEQIMRSQKLYDNERYSFNAEKDIDIHYDKANSSTETHLNEQDAELRDVRKENANREAAINLAVEVINTDITKRNGNPITLENFEPTMFSLIEINDEENCYAYALYPVEVKCTVENIGTYCINIDNPCRADPLGTGAGPAVPHVGFSIPGDDSKKSRSIDGHIIFSGSKTSPDIPTRIKKGVDHPENRNVYRYDQAEQSCLYYVPTKHMASLHPDIKLKMYSNRSKSDGSDPYAPSIHKHSQLFDKFKDL